MTDATLYLDLAETIARQATVWQMPTGAIGDPYNAPGVESITATARYCAAMGHLLRAGRGADLRPHAISAMDWCCSELARHVAAGTQWPGAQFNVKDMMVLYGSLAQERGRWSQALTFDPARTYNGDRNWRFYSTAAETLRVYYGLTAGWEYVDETLDSQMEHWTPAGMYRDPNDPVTYDLTARQALAMMLQYGYAGRHVAWMRDVLHRGALTTLQFISPCGVAPYGGRSNQFHIMEGMIAYLAEWQATQESDPRLQAALRHMALSGAAACRRWIEHDPYRGLKHHMGEAERFGQDGYGAGHNAHSGYGLLAANLFAGAYYVAEKRLTPVADATATRFVHLADAFHRVFATVGDYHVQIDTRGQAGYDATGLGRLHRRGVAIETALNMSCVSAPKYVLPLTPAPRLVALGGGWPCGDGWRYLAEADRESHEVEVVRQGHDTGAAFRVSYRFHDPAGWGAAEVWERYHLTAEGLRCTVTVPGAARVRLQVPVIETDGEARSDVTLTADEISVTYRGGRFHVAVTPAADSLMELWPAPNRNGVYRVAVFEVAGDTVSYTASLQ